jgi:hypothetical protein
MARRKSLHRSRRAHRTKRSRRTRHTKRTRSRRTRRGGDGSIGTPYSAYRMMPLNPNQTLDGQNFSRANQIGGGGKITRYRTGGSTCTGGTLQPSGNNINQSCPNGQMATTLVTGGRA